MSAPADLSSLKPWIDEIQVKMKEGTATGREFQAFAAYFRLAILVNPEVSDTVAIGPVYAV